MRPKIRCDGESTVLLQNFLDLNRALEQQGSIVRMHNVLLGFYWLKQHCQLTALAIS
jgi:hypothetical protein